MLCPSFSYYVNGRDTSLEDFLDPEVLNTLALKTQEVMEVMKKRLTNVHVYKCTINVLQFSKDFKWFFCFVCPQTIELTSPGKKVWLGETSSAYGGGAKGLSDTFVAGFM